MSENTTSVRYVRQRNLSDCGPIALINVLKHLGHPITYADIHLLYKLCKYNKKVGTYFSNMTAAMKGFGIKAIRKSRINCDVLKHELGKGDFFVLAVFMAAPKVEDECYHYTLVTEYDASRNRFKCVNLFSEETVSAVPWETMTQLLANKSKNKANGWVVRVDKSDVRTRRIKKQ